MSPPAFLIGLLLVGAGGADARTPAVVDIPGDWRTLSLHVNGNLDLNAIGNVLEIGRDRFDKVWTILEGGQVTTYEAHYTLNPRASPAQIDIKVAEREDGKPPRSKIARGVYVIEGNRLIICHGEPGLPRPRDFAPLKLRYLMVLERVEHGTGAGARREEGRKR